MKSLFQKTILGLVFVFALMMGSAFSVSALELGGEQDLVVKNYIDNSSTTIKTRFNGNTPFVEFSSLYRLLFDSNITINHVESDTYELITESGKATIDTLNDNLRSDNYSDFIAAPDSNDSDNNEDTPKMIKGTNYKITGAASPTNIDFSKYDIDFYVEDDKIWLPASAGLNIFMQMGFYDGSVLNIIDNNDADFSSTDEYKVKLRSLFNNKRRFGEYAKAAYNGLCFIFDIFYGHPEKSRLGESIKENGLDYTLKTYNDETRLIRDWLLSEDLVEYYAGLVGLNAALYDGGHTNLTDAFKYDFLLDEYPGLTNDESYELYKDLEFYKNKPLDFAFRITRIANARERSLGTEKYTEKGDTVIYSFDKFNFDMPGWNHYYENGGEYPDDTLGGILKALDKALENPNIKNFIFDVSNNGGGMALVAPIIMNYLGYDNMMHEKNTITGQVGEIGFKIDINRDGVYDEKDKVSKYHFDYGVLTSEFTFSTGNLFAAMAEDNGFAILGETSGGGACNVVSYNTSEGMVYSMSAHSCSQNKYGKTVDWGISPNYDLIQIIDGRKNYAKFYDLDILSELMNDFYKKPSNDSESDNSNSANTKNNREVRRASKQNELSLADGTLEENTKSDDKLDSAPKKSEANTDKQSEETEKAPENNVVLYIAISGVGITGLVGVGLYVRKRLFNRV